MSPSWRGHRSSCPATHATETEGLRTPAAPARLHLPRQVRVRADRASTASACCHVGITTPKTALSRAVIEPAVVWPGRLGRIVRSLDRDDLLHRHGNATLFQAGHDLGRKAMPVRFPRGRDIDRATIVRKWLAGAGHFLAQDVQDRVGDDPRGGRRTVLIGDDLQFLRSAARRAIVRRKLRPCAA